MLDATRDAGTAIPAMVEKLVPDPNIGLYNAGHAQIDAFVDFGNIGESCDQH